MADKKLNKQQREAVEHKKGPLLIVAGAGTGKTTVITERIKYLISEELAKPSEILALTFTNKAALEMEERVDIAMPYGYTQMWTSTFHTFCDRILRAEALHIGMDPKYKLMTQAETIKLIRDNLFEFDLKYFRPLGNPNKFIGGMLQHFSRLQDEDVTPSQYLRWVNDQLSNSKSQTKEDKLGLEKWEELSSAYKKYEEIKAEASRLDFGDLIVKTLKLFRERPNVLKEYKDKFKYVLVDEFQDTNYAQNELAMLIAGKGKKVSDPGESPTWRANITVTGDDDQSIYRFRGAAVSNILQFRKNYPKAKLVVLTQNYRTRQEILDNAYKLIKHNNPDRLEAVENIDKELKAVDKKEGETLFFHEERVENEADRVGKEIKRLVDEEEYSWNDIAVLVRANSHADAFIRAFQRHNLPYQFLGPGRLFKQPEIVDLIAYLKVLYDFEDSASLYRLLSIDYFKIKPKDLIRLNNYARKNNVSLFDVCEKVSEVNVSKKTKKTIKKLLKAIKKQFDEVQSETAGQLLYNFLEETGLLVKLLNPDSVYAQKKAKNISKFFDKLKTYEVDNEDATVIAIVDWIELSMEVGESPLAADVDWTDVDAVNILTVHSAKGLEFPVVFLVNLVSRRFPTIHRREQIPIPEEIIKEELPKGDFHIQEERRLFYVGMTRAKERLYFTGANYYGEGKREKKLSPFIFEALGDEVVSSEQKSEQTDQLSYLDYESKTKPSEALAKEGELGPTHIDYLSYSQIQAFSICPLHYKLKYILKVPLPVTATLSFGGTMHETMKDFYTEVKNDPKNYKTKKKLEKLALNLLKENWQKAGYTSKSYEKKMYKRGEKYLKGYIDKTFDKKVLPEAQELPFVVPLNLTSHKVSDPEAQTRGITQGEHPLKIGGKIDRVDVLDDGKLEIIDYKTGENIPNQRKADKDMQLSFYALAATQLKEKPLGKKPDEVKMSLYYFAEQKKVTTKRTKKQLEDVVKEIYDWRERIERSDFKCSGHIFCQKCEYSLFCKADE